MLPIPDQVLTEAQVLQMIVSGRTFDLRPHHFNGRRMTQEEGVAIFKSRGAIWYYQGEPRADQPHALLTSGDHSDGFISCKEVLQYPILLTLFANEVVKMIPYRKEEIGMVISSAYSAITLGEKVADILTEKNQEIIYRTVEKDADKKPTIIRGGIDPRLIVLNVNELMTKPDGSTWQTRRAALECNKNGPAPTIIQQSMVLIGRSENYALPDHSYAVPVFHFKIKNYKADDCPYCKAGSIAMPPKDGTNWKDHFSD